MGISGEVGVCRSPELNCQLPAYPTHTHTLTHLSPADLKEQVEREGIDQSTQIADQELKVSAHHQRSHYLINLQSYFFTLEYARTWDLIVP